MSERPAWTIRWLEGVNEVDRVQWDELALPLPTPLLEWQWLHCLEASGSISPLYGWRPRHLTVWDRKKLIGAAPLYIKTNSDGEFVYDHWWARLAATFGITYYPKMVGMSPATPSAGYRFLMAEGVDPSALMCSMLSAIDAFCRQERLSCCHFNFVDEPWFSQWPPEGMISWRHQAYLWQNLNYGTFEDYLRTFNSSQRRNIRRERRRMESDGIDIRALTGDDIPSDLAGTMYRFYLRTNARYGPWAARYLNGDFFKRIFEDYRHRMLIISATRSPSREPVALSMLLVKDHHLIGRYWGCEAPVKDLHFNMCFYAPIDWAIENGIQTFDPGAGSPHKIFRGFKAVAHNSLHRFYDPRLEILFQRLIGEVNEAEAADIDSLNRLLPFAKSD